MEKKEFKALKVKELIELLQNPIVLSPFDKDFNQ